MYLSSLFIVQDLNNRVFYVKLVGNFRFIKKKLSPVQCNITTVFLMFKGTFYEQGLTHFVTLCPLNHNFYFSYWLYVNEIKKVDSFLF